MDTSTNNPAQVLKSRVVLIYPTMSFWRGQYQLPKARTHITTDGNDVPMDNVTTPRTKLLSDKHPLDKTGVPWRKRFADIENKLAAVKQKYSVAFPINGVRIVPKDRCSEMLGELIGLTYGDLQRQLNEHLGTGNSAKADYVRMQMQDEEVSAITLLPSTPVRDRSKLADEQSVAYMLRLAADEFANEWPAIVSSLAEKNPTFAMVSDKIPATQKAIREKFGISVVPIEINGGTNVTEITEDDLLLHNDVVQEACRAQVEEAISLMIAEPREQLRIALENLNELILRDGQTSSRTFNAVREAIEKIRTFECVATPDLLHQISTLSDRLDRTNVRDVRSSTATGQGLMTAIGEAMQIMKDSQQVEASRQVFLMQGGERRIRNVRPAVSPSPAGAAPAAALQT